jgi:hypothetical protein
MTKNDLLWLLMPSILLVLIAALALSCSGALSFSPQIEQQRQQDFEKLISKVQSGAVQPTKDQWIALLRDSKKVELATEAGQVVLTRFLSGGILVGVALQALITFRIRAAHRKSAT